ncbi:MAG TPA: hypothetical protein PLK35_03215 [Candidatus Moranbacteria bacterium]|nr:hypothetical protein [Candidatus Moranbacteria bacterium]
MKQKILKYSLIFFTLVFSFLGWLSVDRAINVDDSSVWLAPMACFSFFFLFLSLSFILVKEKAFSILTLFLSLSFSLIFIFDISRLVFFLFSLLLLTVALERIRKDVNLNIKVDILKTLGTGKTLMVIAISLFISSQYYSEIKISSRESIVPKIEMGSRGEFITSKILSAINPQFKDIDSQSVTVDQFILETQKSQMNEMGFSVDGEKEIEKVLDQNGLLAVLPDQKETMKQEAIEKFNQSKEEISRSAQELILKEGRDRLSEISGIKLSGNEKISVIFSETINRKINDYFKPKADMNGMPLLPVVLALILFLSIVPLGNFLTIFLTRIAKIIFKILVRLEIIKINKVVTEVEKIE